MGQNRPIDISTSVAENLFSCAAEAPHRDGLYVAFKHRDLRCGCSGIGIAGPSGRSDFLGDPVCDFPGLPVAAAADAAV